MSSQSPKGPGHGPSPEVALEHAEALHRGLVEAIPGGFVHVRADGSIADANAEALRILGLSFDALTGKYTTDFATVTIREDGTPCPVDEYPVTRALTTGQPQPAVTIGVRRPDGGVSWAVFRAVPVRDPRTGATAGAIVTFLDISERTHAEHELARNRDLLRKAQEIAKVGSWEWDLETHEVRWTDQMHEIYGISKDEFDGKVETALRPIHPADADVVRARTARVLEEGRTIPTEYRIVHRDGTVRTVWGSGEIVRAADGTPIKVVGAIQDVTEQREIEARLAQAHRIESIGQLAGGVAHDFNNLMQVILANVERAMRDSDPRRTLDDVVLAVKRGSELTRQLLTFSRRQQSSPIDLDPNELVEEWVRLMSRTLGERYVVALTRGHDVGTVHADPSQLEQVFVNLCINARDAMPEGGRIEIRTGSLDADAAFRATRPWAEPGRYAWIEVRDHGTGMTAEVLARAFEPFYTTKPVGEGSGLGLSVVYGIMGQHHGMVEAESSPDEGCTMRVYLPTVTRQPARRAARTRGETRGGDETVLVVEDETMVRSLVVAALRDAGYSVLTAGCGDEALAALATHPSVDLLLTDVVMPNMDGRELARRVRAAHPKIRQLLTSGHAAGVGRSEPGERMLPKPYATEELLRAVRVALDAAP